MKSMKIVGMLRKAVILNHEGEDLPAKHILSINPKVMVDCRANGLALIYGYLRIGDWKEIMNSFHLVSGLKLDGKYELLNQVIVIDMGFKINLESTCRNLVYAEFEPEQFPGIIFQELDKLTYLIFNSGKVTVTGIKQDVSKNPDYLDVILDIRNELVPGGFV